MSSYLAHEFPLLLSCCIYKFNKNISLIQKRDFFRIFLLSVIVDLFGCRLGSASTCIAAGLEFLHICPEFQLLAFGLLNWMDFLVFFFLLEIDPNFLLVLFLLFLLLLIHLRNFLNSAQNLLIRLLHVN